MKIVINTCFGGYSVNEEVVKRYGLHKYESRISSKLIELIESGINCNGNCAKLKVVNIPDDSTDYMIIEHDGAESIICVIDGKIYEI